MIVLTCSLMSSNRRSGIRTRTVQILSLVSPASWTTRPIKPIQVYKLVDENDNIR
jgi:hypothetical protein